METATSWHSYPKVWALGHAGIKDLLLDPIVVEEKVDGSQFSFGKFNGELRCRSKGQELVVDAPPEMFNEAVATARELLPQLKEGWTYRAEYLRVPKHNIHAYSRVPVRNLILFDINISEEGYLSPFDKAAEAKHLGLELVPMFFEGMLTNIEEFYKLLERESVLGGQKIEGMVIKNYFRFGIDKKVLMGKHVSEAFKEKHAKGWKAMNPQAGDIIEILRGKYKSEVRWSKAVQHLRDAGQLTDSPKDIGPLMKEVGMDAAVELKAEIMEDLYKWAWPQIARTLGRGLAEWYKDQLARKQFGEVAQ